jgi:murein DD-endopeptidase MepM/ murein hydrolase activator NlpD
MNKKIIIFACLLIFFLISGIYFIRHKNNGKQSDTARAVISAQETDMEKKVSPEEKKIEIAVEAGDIFNKVGAKAGLDSNVCYAIYESTKKIYDLAKLNVGNKFCFYPNENKEINKIVYNVDDIQELTIIKQGTSTDWQAQLKNIDYLVKEKTIKGEINASSSSLYESALAQRADERAILQFAGGLEWAIDFANDPRIGDKYKFVYEEKYLDNRFVIPGKVLAGAYLNDGKLLQTFYFEESKDNMGYFDEKGNSVQKVFLKAPLAFKYISSPFTTGRRYIEAFNVSTGHRAVDYAATYGTPIRAVGDGTISYAGWSSGYGNLTSINHNGTYSTNYGHQSKVIVKRGQRVKQGQIIGYVGSTGFSTGPHLHFEMIKNGVKVNPSKEILPPGKPISNERKAEFMKVVEALKGKISL